MGKFKTHFAGALVDGVYCTSGISQFVYDLMTSSHQSVKHQVSSRRSEGHQDLTSPLE